MTEATHLVKRGPVKGGEYFVWVDGCVASAPLDDRSLEGDAVRCERSQVNCFPLQRAHRVRDVCQVERLDRFSG